MHDPPVSAFDTDGMPNVDKHTWFFRSVAGLGAAGVNSSEPTEPDLDDESCRRTLIP
ncbi:hypothetical protein FRC12_003978, partial [Ceratobasidium sp. 428]